MSNHRIQPYTPSIKSIFIYAVLLMLALPAHALDTRNKMQLKWLQDSCQQWQLDQTIAPFPLQIKKQSKEPLVIREQHVGDIITIDHSEDKTFRGLLRFEAYQPPNRPIQFIATSSNQHNQPLTFINLNNTCNFRHGRMITYQNGVARNLVSLDAELQVVGNPQPLNPETLPFVQPEATRPHTKVALVDSGVNYLLPEINRGLARDGNGNILGYDFWEMDRLPFDVHFSRSPFFIRHHGTRTASVLLDQTSNVALVPYRYPRPALERMPELIAHADNLGIRLVGLPLGSNNKEDWTAFSQAVRQHPHILFIVSAGNNGRDIDQEPVYPAALSLPNMLVVSSADDFLRPAERTNWGPATVDYLLPAESIPAIDYNGQQVSVSGSSYAVPRMMVLAADVLAQQPDIGTDMWIRKIDDQVTESHNRFVKKGFIADPRALQQPVEIENDKPIQIDQSNKTLQVTLDILVTDPEWQNTLLQSAIHQANHIWQDQCGVQLFNKTLSRLLQPDYLKDLSVGNARTLMRTHNRTRHKNAVSIIFARDSLMQEAFDGEAFGVGNTRNRPWLTNSVWLMQGVQDPGIALAHELFHILSNSGRHSRRTNNLMNENTSPQNIDLTQAQCDLAIFTGQKSGLVSAFTSN